jgi:hypothetical protein
MPGSAFFENLCLELLKGKNATAPASLRLALCESTQVRTLTGATLVNELNYTGYERVAINLAEETITAGVEGAAAFMLNSLAIALKPNTGAAEHNSAQAWVLVDGAAARGSAANVWVFGTLEEVVAIVKAMETVSIPAKALKIEVN